MRIRYVIILLKSIEPFLRKEAKYFCHCDFFSSLPPLGYINTDELTFGGLVAHLGPSPGVPVGAVRLSLGRGALGSRNRSFTRKKGSTVLWALGDACFFLTGF